MNVAVPLCGVTLRTKHLALKQCERNSKIIFSRVNTLYWNLIAHQRGERNQNSQYLLKLRDIKKEMDVVEARS